MSIITPYLWTSVNKATSVYEIRRRAITEYIRNNTSVYIDYDKMEEVAKEAETIMDTGIKQKDAMIAQWKLWIEVLTVLYNRWEL